MLRRFIDFAGESLGIDGDYLFRNGSWVSLRYLTVSAIGLATTIAFTRLASKETYGAYQYIISSVAFFSFLSLPGLNTAALKAVVKGDDSAVFRAIKWSFFSGLLGVPCILIYGMSHPIFRDIPIVLVAVVALTFAPFYALNTWYVFYEGRQNFFSVAWRSMLAASILFFSTVIILWMGWSLTVLIASYFILSLVMSFVFCAEIWLKTNPVAERQTGNSLLDFRYGLSVTAQKLVFNASETLPLLAIGSVYGFAEVAVFQIAFFVYSSIAGYIGALIAMYLPKFFSGTQLGKGKMLTHNLFSGMLIAIGLAGFLFLIFPLLFDDRYAESMQIAWYLLPATILLPLKSYLTSYFTANGKIVLIVSVYVVANIISGLMFYLLRSSGAGIAGAAYVTSLVCLITLSLTLGYFPERAPRKTDSI